MRYTAAPIFMSLSGGTFYASELARRYGVRDIGNLEPPSHRALLGAPLMTPCSDSRQDDRDRGAA